MDGIARSAGVSVKTIYGHFANKDELFSQVMIAACSNHLLSGEIPPNERLAERFAWFRQATRRGLMEAGRDYLHHLLSEEQVALYRVVTRDADRFPELGRQYQKNFARGRTGILIAYLKRVAEKRAWKKRDATQDAAFYEALLRAGIYEEVLHGLLTVHPDAIAKQVRTASETMWNGWPAVDRLNNRPRPCENSQNSVVGSTSAGTYKRTSTTRRRRSEFSHGLVPLSRLLLGLGFPPSYQLPRFKGVVFAGSGSSRWHRHGIALLLNSGGDLRRWFGCR